MINLLCPFRKPGPPSSASTDSALSSPTSPLGEAFFPSTSSSRSTVIYIDILPKGSHDKTNSGAPSSLWSDAGYVIHASDHPRRLESINPTVSFTAPSTVVAHSRFTVYSEEIILHAETVPLVLLRDQAPHPSGFVYSAQLIPKYWKVIVDSPGTYDAFGTALSKLIFIQIPLGSRFSKKSSKMRARLSSSRRRINSATLSNSQIFPRRTLDRMVPSSTCLRRVCHPTMRPPRCQTPDTPHTKMHHGAPRPSMSRVTPRCKDIPTTTPTPPSSTSPPICRTM